MIDIYKICCIVVGLDLRYKLYTWYTSLTYYHVKYNLLCILFQYTWVLVKVTWVQTHIAQRVHMWRIGIAVSLRGVRSHNTESLTVDHSVGSVTLPTRSLNISFADFGKRQTRCSRFKRLHFSSIHNLHIFPVAS